MKVIEKTGRTPDEAVAAALKELGVEKDRAIIEVLEEGSKGLFGLLGSRLARVRVTVKDDPVDVAYNFLQGVLKQLGLQVRIEVFRRPEKTTFQIHGANVGLLIGRRGQTLDSLQYLTSLVANKVADEHLRIIVDVENYREKRAQALQKLALHLAEKVRKTKQKVVLEPMNPQERRVIHTALQGMPDIHTYSEGEDPYRKVIITYK